MTPEQEAYTTLRGLVPIARLILELEEVFEVGLNLQSTIAALESRKQALTLEVTDVLKRVEALRQERVRLVQETR